MCICIILYNLVFNNRNIIVNVDQPSVRSPTGLTRSDSLEELTGQFKDMYKQFEGKDLSTQNIV